MWDGTKSQMNKIRDIQKLIPCTRLIGEGVLSQTALYKTKDKKFICLAPTARQMSKQLSLPCLGPHKWWLC